MGVKNKHKTIGQKAQIIKRKVTASVIGFTPIHMLVKNRRATSAVVSNLILIAAVIVVGFVALAYARSNSNNYQTQYQQTVNSDIGKLKEMLSFEYIFYNSTSKNVYVYFLNSGTTNVKIDMVFLSLSQNVSFSLFYKNGNLDSSHTIDVGQEGYIVSNVGNLTSGTYTVKLTTARSSSFEYNFAI